MYKNHIDYTKLTECSLAVALGPKHPLYQTNMDSVGVEILSKYPVVSYDSCYDVGMWGNSLFSDLVIPHSVVVNSRSSLHALLNNTDAIKLSLVVNPGKTRNQNGNLVRKIPLSGVDLGLEIGWICRNGYQHSEPSRYFVDRLTEKFRK